MINATRKVALIMIICMIVSINPITTFDFSVNASETNYDVSEDAFAYGGEPSIQHGGSSTIIIKDSASTLYDRIGYMKVNLTGCSEALINKATLKFYSESTVAVTPVKVYGLTDDSWSESTLTWNSQPSGQIYIGTVNVSSAGWYSINVTDFVNSQMIDKIVSFKLVDESQKDTYISIKSKESSTNKPYMTIDTLPDIVAVNPSADSYVRGGTYADINYGTTTLLASRYHSDGEWCRESYFKFDLSNINSTADNAYLKLYITSADSGAQLNVFSVSSDSWTESQITWNNKPAADSTAIAAKPNIIAGWAVIDITNYVNSELSGDKIITLCVKSNDTKYIYFNSKEATNKPVLEINTKPTTATVLMNKGLGFVWQDQLHVRSGQSFLYTSPNDLFQPNKGYRAGVYNTDERRSFIMDTDGRRLLKVTQLTNGNRNENYSCGWWPANYKEFGLSVDVFVPSDINLDATNATDGDRVDGKTSFGVQLGVYDLDRPGGINSSLNVSQVCYPQNQKGAACFMNWSWRKSTGQMQFQWYHYAVRKNGVLRDDNYGYSEGKFNVPMGRWFTLTNYVKMDTNGQNGVLETWITDQGTTTRVSYLTGLDFGGAVMDRGITSGTGTLVGTGGGWSIHNTYAAEMVGGVIYDFIYGADPFYKARNFRVYGKE